MVYKCVVKRLLDIIFAILGILIGLVPMVIVAILIKLESSGPVLFKQERYGQNSKKFLIYKFRTMRTDAPILANQNFKDMKKYISPLGAFLRKTSLDELPQLFNVLRGEMSFIGPRPLAKTDMNVIKMRQVNGGDLVRPGITGLAQVNGRNKISDNEKAAFDAEYAENLNFVLEFNIVWQTIRAVLKRDGINKNDVDV
ncbi:sugar transferase [Weissella confusa]|uniref:sugar transferase n=1 Tax=Weissella confusa TaxID=1583 RepID=UPI00223A9596|nr:sugar transferase [Weissella confusa]MCS9992947.1 sugar transferase [Weissella confusa]